MKEKRFTYKTKLSTLFDETGYIVSLFYLFAVLYAIEILLTERCFYFDRVDLAWTLNLVLEQPLLSKHLS